jgi:hypothetical protein
VRDDTGATLVCWRGSTAVKLPWARITDEEYLRYQVADERPADASAHGEARTEIHLADRPPAFTSILDLDGDPGTLKLPLPLGTQSAERADPRAQLAAAVLPRPPLILSMTEFSAPASLKSEVSR